MQMLTEKKSCRRLAAVLPTVTLIRGVVRMRVSRQFLQPNILHPAGERDQQRDSAIAEEYAAT